MTYFVTYTHIQANGPVFGNIGITRDSNINSMDDIRDMEKLIKTKYGYDQLVILDWKKF